MSQPEELTDFENGQLALIGIELGLFEPDVVRRWADSLIEREAEPATWMIDLALITKATAWELLHGFARQEPSLKVLRIVLTLIARKWAEGRLTKSDLEQVARSFWGWSVQSEVGLIGYAIASICEEFDAGWITEQQFHDFVDERLAPLYGDGSSIPWWLQAQ